MLGANKLVIWVLTGMLAVTTVFFNLYIVLATLWNDRERKQRTPSDTIITALSAASGAHQLLCYFWMTMDELDRECLLAQVPYSVMLLLIFSMKFTVMWNTGFLTSHYSNKLVTSATNPCNTKIHAAIIKHVTLAVFLIPLFGLAVSMPMLVVLHHENNTSENDDCGVMIPDSSAGKVYEAMYLILADVLPGVVMIKCCVAISVHLGVHLRNMKASTNGAHGPKFGAQIRVIQMTLSIVAAFLCFLVVDLYVHYQIAAKHENVIALTFFVTSLYTAVAAMVLVYGKKTLWKCLIRDLNGCLREYPCLSFLKVPEESSKPSSPPQIKA